MANISEKTRVISETEMVRPCGEQSRRICSNENMEDGRPKLRWCDVIR